MMMNGPNMHNSAPKPNKPKPTKIASVRPKNSINAKMNLIGSVMISNNIDAMTLPS